MTQLKDLINVYDGTYDYKVELRDKNEKLICICSENAQIFNMFKDCEVKRWHVDNSLDDTDFIVTLDV